MNLAELQKETHAIAKEKGWWDIERTFGDCIALIHSGLSEALEAYREYSDCLFHYRWHPMEDEVADEWISNDALTPVLGVPMELADVVIRVMDMAGWYERDLTGAVELARNEDDHPDNVWDVEGKASFGDRLSDIHHELGQIWWWATNRKFNQSEWVECLGQVVYKVGKMAAHYGIDLDAAIAANMEYLRRTGRC